MNQVFLLVEVVVDSKKRRRHLRRPLPLRLPIRPTKTAMMKMQVMTKMNSLRVEANWSLCATIASFCLSAYLSSPADIEIPTELKEAGFVPVKESNMDRISIDIRPTFNAESGPVGYWPSDPKEHFAQFILPILNVLKDITKDLTARRRRTVLTGLSEAQVYRFAAFEIFSGIVQLPQEKQYFRNSEKPWCTLLRIFSA
jgi:hypothetical protein